MWTLSARDCVSERIAAVSPGLAAQRSKISQNASIHFPSMRSESMGISSLSNVVILRSAPRWVRVSKDRPRTLSRSFETPRKCAAPHDDVRLLLDRRNNRRMLELRGVHFLRQQPGLREGVVHGLDRREIGRGAGIAAKIIVLQKIGFKYGNRRLHHLVDDLQRLIAIFQRLLHAEGDVANIGFRDIRILIDKPG